MARLRLPRRAWLAVLVTGAIAAALAAGTAGAAPGSAPAPAVTVPAPAPATPALAVVETTTTVSIALAAPPLPAAVPDPAPPVEATPTRPIHDWVPQAAAGETAADVVTITDDGFGNPVETGPAEVRRLGQPLDTTDLAELCGAKPWLCDDSYAH